MVTWIWLGGLIVLFGGVLAGWPTPRGLTRVASARYAARVGRDVREQVARVAVGVLLIFLVVAAACADRHGAAAQVRRAADERLEAERAELDALKEAKYREIRDAELDYRTGKLAEADWRVLDRTLRAEAVEL